MKPSVTAAFLAALIAAVVAGGSDQQALRNDHGIPHNFDFAMGSRVTVHGHFPGVRP